MTRQSKRPQSNGVSERAVKTVEGLLKKSEDQYEPLLAYRSTPLSNGYSQTEILGRKLRMITGSREGEEREGESNLYTAQLKLLSSSVIAEHVLL